MEDYRFGTEVSSKVKVISGLKGIIHSDEKLEKYNFSQEEIEKLFKKRLNFYKQGLMLIYPESN